MILKRVGESGTLTFHDFSRISCDEEIISETYRGRRLAATHHKFVMSSYLAQLVIC